MRPLKPLILLAALVFAVVLWQRQAPTDSQPPQTATASQSLPAFLPPEARTTLDLIARGGPCPHSQDGVVFGNYEHRLPAQPRGYYHEYTVETPGADNRGTRRVITGGTPPEIYYYTDDHYGSFRSFKVSR
jgi:guanyl-specific ribonuclease Sa